MSPKAFTSSEFDRQYRALNKAQKKAVDTIEGPVMVIAGPGTGKTTILALRIANILRLTDVPPSAILAITYTDAGVKAMRAKLHGIIGTRAHEVHIHTFHSFASAIIAEYPDHFLELEGLKPMSDIEQESLIRSILTDKSFADLRPAGKPEAYVGGILRGIDEAKREAMTPVMVKAHAESEIKRIKNDADSKSTRGATKGQLKAEAQEAIEKCERTLLFSDIYELYEKRKRAEKKMDFGDLIIELLRAMAEDELLLRLIQERFQYIHVDEHQDTNDSQNIIVKAIAQFFDEPNVFIVGDEKQAIYRFQGASVENFLSLRERWPAMQLISLDTNYRSHQGILDAGFAMIEKNYGDGEHADLRVRLKSGGQTKSRPIEVVTGADVASVELHLIDALKSLAKNEPESTAAIIVRRNRDLDRVIRLLESHGIPVASERSIDIFNHPAGSVFFDFLQYLADPSRTDMLARTIAAGMWGLKSDAIPGLVADLKGGHQARALAALPGLADIRKDLMRDDPVGFIIRAAEHSGYVALIARDPAYTHVWRGLVALSESLVRERQICQPSMLIEALQEYRLSAESRPVKITVGSPDVKFKAMTAHGSKGLEFDYVFMPYATEESWIGRPRGASFVLPRKQTSDSDPRDIRRLFYVALTRAKKHAVILVGSEESDGKALMPLRFISELDLAHVKAISIPRAPELSFGVDSGESPEKGKAALVDLAKRVLIEKGLSVTALNHFMKCPSLFLYQSILKLPQAPSAAAEKGTAMHGALAAVWHLKSRTPAAIEACMIKTIKESLEHSLLPKHDKEAVKRELIEDAPAVAKALSEHFNIKGNIFTEHWVENIFTAKFNGETLNIPIHGKLDAIVDTGHEALVYDYKTRQAMSIAAIKGETKSSDGAYFRQLIFYKMLLLADSRWKNRRISPSLVFVSPDSKGRCPTISIPIDAKDIARVQGEIKSLIESVWSGLIASERCDDAACEWCGLKNLL